MVLTLVVSRGIWEVQGRADWEPWPDSCQSLSPGNDIPPQTGPCPFQLILDDQVTTCDGVIYVTIKGPEPLEFAGFMIQARTRKGKVVGRFLEADDVKLMDCFGTTEEKFQHVTFEKLSFFKNFTQQANYFIPTFLANTAINLNYLPKEEIITRWRPDGFMGNATIYASVAKDYLEQEYWLGLHSKPIKCTRPKYT